MAFGGVGLLAWLPGRGLALEPVQVAQLVAWPLALAAVTSTVHSELANR